MTSDRADPVIPSVNGGHRYTDEVSSDLRGDCGWLPTCLFLPAFQPRPSSMSLLKTGRVISGRNCGVIAAVRSAGGSGWCAVISEAGAVPGRPLCPPAGATDRERPP